MTTSSAHVLSAYLSFVLTQPHGSIVEDYGTRSCWLTKEQHRRISEFVRTILESHEAESFCPKSKPKARFRIATHAIRFVHRSRAITYEYQKSIAEILSDLCDDEEMMHAFDTVDEEMIDHISSTYDIWKGNGEGMFRKKSSRSFRSSSSSFSMLSFRSSSSFGLSSMSFSFSSNRRPSSKREWPMTEKEDNPPFISLLKMPNFKVLPDVQKEKEKSFNDSIRPNEKDVLFGRGSEIYRHKGNVRWRELINQKKDEYRRLGSSTNKKKHFSAGIVREVKNYGGRFLERDHKMRWCVVPEDQARLKCSQQFRDIKRKVSTKMNKKFNCTKMNTASMIKLQ